VVELFENLVRELYSGWEGGLYSFCYYCLTLFLADFYFTQFNLSLLHLFILQVNAAILALMARQEETRRQKGSVNKGLDTPIFLSPVRHPTLVLSLLYPSFKRSLKIVSCVRSFMNCRSIRFSLLFPFFSLFIYVNRCGAR
jgi:hypothetical protein